MSDSNWDTTIDPYGRLEAAARTCRVVCLAGMPGVGKSLILQRATQLAARHGRRVHLLRWDGARLAFDVEPYAQRYAEVDGVTHPVIRRAVGTWARSAIERWCDATTDEDLLLAETPLLGNRFLELAVSHDDAAEHVLSTDATRFIVIVPSAEVRHAITKARRRDLKNPRTLNDQKSAAPSLIAAQWTELVRAAHRLGMVTPDAECYDPELYWSVYARILIRRQCERLSINGLVSVPAQAAGDIPADEMLPTKQDVDAAFRIVEETPVREVVEQVTDWAAGV